jgi:uncharacterized membrane protein YqhA
VTSDVGEPAGSESRPAGSKVSRGLEASRYLAAVGAVTSVVLAAVSFSWAVAKAVSFVISLIANSSRDEVDLVKLFESIDTILIGTVLLMLGVGLWELFVGDLALPDALTADSFDELKAKLATTLLLVLVVRFLEALVVRPAEEGLVELGIAVTLVGALLLVFARWRR